MTTLSCSSFHSICIDYNDNVFAFGGVLYCKCGFKENKLGLPKQITSLSHISIKSVSCGIYHCICLSYDSIVYTFGSNTNGQLGVSNSQTETIVPQIPLLPPVSKISAGSEFNICLSNNGDLYSFGKNNCGQLGVGITNNTEFNTTPQQITNLREIHLVECGSNHTICKSYKGDIYSWGKNNLGQLGSEDYQSYYKPFHCTNWPNDIISIKCGSNHSLILSSSGFVYSFGSNDEGQLGIPLATKLNIPDKIEKLPIAIKRIECGNNHSMCIDEENNLWLFGDNRYGQLGLGDTNKRVIPEKHKKLQDVIDISHGGHVTIVKLFNNKVYSMGYNCKSQAGIPNGKSNINSPIKKPEQIFKDNEEQWKLNLFRSKQKSARK